MRLNWLGPLPPNRSAAAAFAARLLPFLKTRAAVTVWTPRLGWDRGLERWVAVREFALDAPPWSELNVAEATLYHLGSDAEQDRPLLDVLRQHPGIAVLHDWSGSLADLDRATAVIVSQPKLFRVLKERQRWPVLFAPPPWERDDASSQPLGAYKGYAEQLLSFADESRWFGQRLTAEELARKASAEMNLWSESGRLPGELRRAAREICTLTGGASPAAALEHSQVA